MQTLEKINKMTGNSELDTKGCFLKMIKEIKNTFFRKNFINYLLKTLLPKCIINIKQFLIQWHNVTLTQREVFLCWMISSQATRIRLFAEKRS